MAKKNRSRLRHKCRTKAFNPQASSKTDVRPGMIVLESSKSVAVDEKSVKAMAIHQNQKKTSPRTLQEEIQIAVLKANHLGACGLKVTSIEFLDNCIELKADSFSQEELNSLKMKRDMSLATQKRDLLEKVLQARFKKHSDINVENLTDKEVENLIQEFESITA